MEILEYNGKGAPAPLESLSLARKLVAAEEFLPAHLMLAVGAALLRASNGAFTAVDSYPGRRGNPALRRQAFEDQEQARELLQLVHERWWLLQDWRPDAAARARSRALAEAMSPARQAESLPDLGAQQLDVLATLAPTFPGSATELALVAEQTIPQDQPLQLDDWRRWARRLRWERAVNTACDMASNREEDADVAERTLRRALDCAKKAKHDRLTSLAEASELRVAESAHRQALALQDEQLKAYELAVDSGVHPSEALRQAPTAG
ncbi:MAG: hypothetical protein ACTHQ3_01370 [Motilibacteraceae bacterium]